MLPITRQNVIETEKMETANRTPLASLHDSLAAVWMPLPGWSVPAHYGNPKNEYAVLQNQAVLFDLSHWMKLAVTGSERKPFIHGMVTNEVKKLEEGMGNYSLFLNAKGKIVADCFLSDAGESLFLYGREANRKPLFEGLNKYLIMEDAEITDQTEQLAMLSIQGKRAEEVLRKIATDIVLPQKLFYFTQIMVKGCSCRVFRSNHTGYSGYDFVCSVDDAPVVWNVLNEAGCLPAGWNGLECARIEAGIPVLNHEVDDTVIPQEAALHHAISFEKGCYIGQETVARLHFRGHVNRELTGFVLNTDEVYTGEIVLQHEGKEVGKITSAVRSYTLDQTIGLGYLRVALRQAGTCLTALCGKQEISVTVSELPFIQTDK